jgi:hypothetical protein
MPIAINGSGTITGISAGGLPDATITQAELATGIGGTGPAFRAYLSSGQTITTSVRTKVTLNATTFDTTSSFNTSTNRYTPSVAGYYFLTASAALTGGTLTAIVIAIWKNGSEVTNTAFLGSPGSGSTYGATDLIYMNGTTDYLELYVQINASGTPAVSAGSTLTYLTGTLVRAA